MVASSVAGLSPDDVSLVDQAGRLLSNTGGDAASRASNAQVQLQNKVERQLSDSINALMTPLVGGENFTAQVHADLNFAEVQSTRESYPKETAVVQREEGAWTADQHGAGGVAGGVPGTLSNQAPPAAQVAAAPNGAIVPAIPGAPQGLNAQAGANGKTSENYNREYQLDRQVSVTKEPVGTIRRLSVAVAIKQGGAKLKASDRAELENLIKGAVGFDATRGDVVAVSFQKFAPVPEAEEPPFYEAPWLSTLGKNIGLLVLAAILVFGLGKPLLAKRPTPAKVDAARRAAIGNEISHALSEQQRSGSGGQITLDMIEATPGYSNRAELIRNFVRQDPARAALVVRDLIRSDMPGGDEKNG